MEGIEGRSDVSLAKETARGGLREKFSAENFYL
jgi:hypothetical protein